MDVGAGMEVDGYWGPVTASIDWCEDNYAVTFYVAEFFNTISNVVLLVLGSFGAYMCHRQLGKGSLDLVFLFATVAITGLGSAAFHGTLVKWAQHLDETPMIIGVTQKCYLLYKNFLPNNKGYLWPTLLILHNVGFAYFHWKYEWVVFFQVYFCAWAVLAALRIIYLYRTEFKNLPAVRSIIQVYFATWITGSIFWLLDLHFCDTMKTGLPFYPHGHSIWHITVGTASYLGPLALCYYEAVQRGLKPRIGYAANILPMVTRKTLND